MTTATEAAKHIDLGDRRFRELLDDGVIERKALGEYSLDEVRVSYIRHLRKVAAGRGAGSDVDLAEERAKLTREQTESAALKNAIARGEYVLVEEVGHQVEDNFSMVRQRIIAIPGRTADSLEGLNREEREQLLIAEVTEALNELHSAADIIDRSRGTT